MQQNNFISNLYKRSNDSVKIFYKNHLPIYGNPVKNTSSSQLTFNKYHPAKNAHFIKARIRKHAKTSILKSKLKKYSTITNGTF